MSQWTHVNISIRVDTYAMEHNNHPNPKITLLTTPTGSEGPLKSKFHRLRQEKYSPYFGIYNIYGDLRDYNDAKEILYYVRGILACLKEQHCGVRGVSGTIEVGGENPYVLLYDYESKHKVNMIQISDALKVLYAKETA